MYDVSERVRARARLERRVLVKTLAILVAAMAVVMLPVVLAPRQVSAEWTEVQAVVSSQPTPSSQQRDGVWVAEVTYKGESIIEVVDPQAHMGDELVAYIDADGDLYRAPEANASPNASLMRVFLLVAAGMFTAYVLAMAVCVVSGLFNGNVEVFQSWRSQRKNPKSVSARQ